MVQEYRPRQHLGKPLCERQRTEWHVDPHSPAHYIDAMIEELTTGAAENELWRLERRVDDLIGLCERLREENRSLEGRLQELTAERDKLLEKNDIAQDRVEAIMARLRAIEPNA